MSKENAIKLAKQLNRYKGTKEKYFVFIGAGVSKSAGIPIASELVNIINDNPDFEDDLEDLTNEERQNYGKCMEALHKSARMELIKGYVDNSSLNWGHIALAILLQSGYVQRVLTFNFDNLLTKSCAQLGFFPAIYDFTATNPELHELISDPAIIHLHGQSDGLEIYNDDDETSSSAKRQSTFTNAMFNQGHCVFIGYSGEADSFFKVIKSKFKGINRLVWVGVDESIPSHVKTHLKDKYKSVKYYHCKGADEFLLDVVIELGLFPPPYLKNPYQHLLCELSKISDLPKGREDNKQYLGNVKEKLKELSEEHKNSKETEFESLLAAKKFHEVIRRLDTKKTKTATEKNFLFRAHYQVTYDLEKELKTRGKDAYPQLAYHYKQALNANPGSAAALNNWGYDIKTLGDMTDDPEESLSLYKQAIGKYQQALELNPDDQKAIKNEIFLSLKLLHFHNISNKSKIFKRVYELLKMHEEIEPNELYNFACYHSVKGEFSEAKNKLLHCKDQDTLPVDPKIYILNDEDLKPLQEADPEWFQKFLDSLPDEE